MASRRFPQPWKVVQIPGGYRVDDAHGQALVFVYGRDHAGASTTYLTQDETRRIALGVARLPELAGRRGDPWERSGGQ